MTFLLTMLILAARPAAPMDDRDANAVEVFRCDFAQGTDVDFDGWPDHWSRRRGRGFPVYVAIGIQRDANQSGPGGGGRLRVDMDGGAAAIFSPPIEVSPAFSYVLEGSLKIENLKHDAAYFEVTFRDSQDRPVEHYDSEHYRVASDWTKVRVGPIAPACPDVRSAVIGLHVSPSDKADLRGAAMFDDIWLGRLPRMTLSANGEHHVYGGLDGVAITCRVSGAAEPNPRVRFELLDVDGRQVAVVEQDLRDAGSDSGQAGGQIESRRDTTKAAKDGFAGAAIWKPAIQDYGFYRVQAALLGPSGPMHSQSVNLALLRPTPCPAGGQFGWSLCSGQIPLPLNTLVDLLGHMGIRWVKLPVWCSEKDAANGDRLARFADRLSSQGMELVGVLDRPPEDAQKLFDDTNPPSAASVFLEPGFWQPIVAPVMLRLSPRVRWWQLGDDDDVSFVDIPGLEKRIREIRRGLEQFGQQIHLGIGWRWLNESPRSDSPPWDYLSYTESPPLTSEELPAYLGGDEGQSGDRWVVLQPLPRDRYSVRVRAQDLAARMLAARVHGAEGIFVSRPFDAQCGLMTEDGQPGELLLPWRTTALAISAAEHLGEMSLPGGSRNHVFARGEEAVMAIWSDQPASETVSLGDEVRQVDLWGRVTTPQSVNEDGRSRQIIEVGPLPTFLTGVNPAIARWCMSLAFDQARWPSVLGRPQTAVLRFQNSFEQEVRGKIHIHAPDLWDSRPGASPFQLAAGKQREETLQVRLRSDARAGSHAVRIDFDIEADRRHQFSVYRTISLGLGDIMLEMTTHLGDGGELMVDQHLINQTDHPVSFNCLLFAPDRRRQRIQVLHADHGRTTNRFVLPGGQELIGKSLWLRAEELGGVRVLNHRAIATP